MFAAKTSICEVLQSLFGRHGNFQVSDNSGQGQEMRVKKETNLKKKSKKGVCAHMCK